MDKLRGLLKHLFRMVMLFVLVGVIYCVIEILYRGYSHWSMFLLAGFLGVFCIDMPNNIYSFGLDYRWQVLISTILCTIGEGLCGLYVNVYKGWEIWNYSSLPFSFCHDQVNLFFIFAWALLIGLIGIPFCDWVNYVIFKIDPAPYYQIKGKVFLRFPERKIK